MNNFNFKLIYKKHKNIDWILPAIVWSLLFGFLVMLFSGYLLGYRVYSVLGRSSEPDIHLGSIVIDYKVPFEELKVGDYVTWSRGGKVFVTHKIIEIQNENYIVTSQTDYFADEGEIVNPDAPITYKNIYGKVIFSIPLLGDIFLGIKNLILINNSINIIGLLNIVLTVVTYYLFKKLLHVETYILKGY